MPQEKAGGPAALLLTAAAARRYFDGVSKSEIAAELGVSRFKVAGLLDHARASGLLRIEFDYRGELDLSPRLRLAYGLRHCAVVDCPDDDEALLRAALGRAPRAREHQPLGPIVKYKIVAVGFDTPLRPCVGVARRTATASARTSIGIVSRALVFVSSARARGRQEE